jgi:hypothetical protein
MEIPLCMPAFENFRESRMREFRPSGLTRGEAAAHTAPLLLGKRYPLLDRDTKFAESFMHVLEQGGVKCRRLPPRLEIAVRGLTVTYAPLQEK